MREEAQAPMAEAIEVGGQLLHAALVVDTDVRDVAPRRSDVVEHDRNPLRAEFGDQLRVHFGDNGGEAGDPASEHQPDAGDQAFGPVVGVGHDHFVAGVVGPRLDGTVNIEEEGVVDVRDDDPDASAGPPARVRACGFGL